MELVSDIKPKPTQEQAIEIVEFLNEHARKRIQTYKRGTKKPSAELRYVIARLNEGYKPNELRAIIVVQTRLWSDENMRPYLKPSTLFGPDNIEKYYGNLEVDDGV